MLEPPIETGWARNAQDALLKVKEALKRHRPSGNPPIRAAGIDAPLFWSKQGDRQIDEVIRGALRATKFPRSKLGGTPMTVNSLPGACVVQGQLLVKILRENSELPITESHPAAFYHLLKHSGQPGTVETFDMAQRLIENLAEAEHERDATLCVVAAWAMMHYKNSPGWQNLYEVEKHESCPIQPFDFDPPVSYWMPIP